MFIFLSKSLYLEKEADKFNQKYLIINVKTIKNLIQEFSSIEVNNA